MLRIEVKGLSGSVANAQLSPNEYDAFTHKSSSYRLAIVTKALDSPQLIICRYSREHSKWVVEGNTNGVIDIETRQSATVQVQII